MSSTPYISATVSDQGLGIRIAGSQEPDLKFEDLIRASAFLLHVPMIDAESLAKEKPGSLVYAYQWAITRLQEAGFKSDKFPLWPQMPATTSVLKKRLPNKNRDSIDLDEKHLGQLLNDFFKECTMNLFDHLKDNMTLVKVMLAPPASPTGDEDDVVTIYQFLISAYISWCCYTEFSGAPLEKHSEILDRLLSQFNEIYPGLDAEADAKECATDKESGSGHDAPEKVAPSDAQNFFVKLVENIKAARKLLRYNVKLDKLLPWLFEAEKAYEAKVNRRYRDESLMRSHLQAGWLLVIAHALLGLDSVTQYHELRKQYVESADDSSDNSGATKCKLDEYFQWTIKEDIDQHLRKIKWISRLSYGTEKKFSESYRTSLTDITFLLTTGMEDFEKELESLREERAARAEKKKEEQAAKEAAAKEAAAKEEDESSEDGDSTGDESDLEEAA